MQLIESDRAANKALGIWYKISNCSVYFRSWFASNMLCLNTCKSAQGECFLASETDFNLLSRGGPNLTGRKNLSIISCHSDVRWCRTLRSWLLGLQNTAQGCFQRAFKAGLKSSVYKRFLSSLTLLFESHLQAAPYCCLNLSKLEFNGPKLKCLMHRNLLILLMFTSVMRWGVLQWLLIPEIKHWLVVILPRS